MWRPPAVWLPAAEEYAFLDVMSGGRLDFGVGRGYQPGEFKGLRLDPTESRDRFKENRQAALAEWRQQLTPRPTSHATGMLQ